MCIFLLEDTRMSILGTNIESKISVWSITLEVRNRLRITISQWALKMIYILFSQESLFLVYSRLRCFLISL